MNINFNLEDTANVVNDLVEIACDIAQERNFVFDNREALRSRNPVSVSNQLYMTDERYKVAIEIFSMIFNIAEKVASSPPREKSSSRTSECKYCPNYHMQDSLECQRCGRLSYLTYMIPIYAVMLKAGEKGIEWGADWFIKQLVSGEDVLKVREQFYYTRRQHIQTGGGWV